MIRLGEEILKVNNSLKKISENEKLFGLVRVAEKGTEKINYDTENRPVVFDDKYAFFAYHKSNSITLEPIRDRGKSKTYQCTANVNLIVYSNDTLHDDIITALSSNQNVVINSIDMDAYKILKSETSITGFDFKKYIFSINYSLIYTQNCAISCHE